MRATYYYAKQGPYSGAELESFDWGQMQEFFILGVSPIFIS